MRRYTGLHGVDIANTIRMTVSAPILSWFLLLLPLVHSTLIETVVDPVIKNEGDSFSMRCDIRYVQENNLLQFVRENAVFVNENGQTSLDTPYNITVDGTEFPENMTDLRFEATLDMTGTTAVYTLTITEVQSGNQGNISCQHIGEDGNLIYKKIVSLQVNGLIRSVEGSILLADNTVVPWSDVYHFNLSEQVTYTARMLVNFSSTVTPVEMYIQEKGSTPRRNLTSIPTVNIGHMTMTIHDSPTLSIVISKPFDFELRPSSDDNDRVLIGSVVRAVGGDPITRNVTMNVTFVPELRQCAAKNVVAKPGTESTELSCQLKSNPAPYEVTWYKGYPAEMVQAGSRFFVDNQYDGDMLTSTLTIHNVTEVDYTDYYVAASNVNGQSEPPEKDDYRVTLTASSGTRESLTVVLLGLVLICKTFQ